MGVSAPNIEVKDYVWKNECFVPINFLHIHINIDCHAIEDSVSKYLAFGWLFGSNKIWHPSFLGLHFLQLQI